MLPGASKPSPSRIRSTSRSGRSREPAASATAVGVSAGWAWLLPMGYSVLMYFEFFARDWGPAPEGARPYLGGTADMKLMNTHLHLMEAFATLRS